MKIKPMIPISLLLATAGALAAEPSRDCLLTGTVHKSLQGGEEVVDVTFRSVEKFDEDANCRVRRNEKLEFKLPADPRLKSAPEGSAVEYRYREDGQGNTETELLRVGNST